MLIIKRLLLLVLLPTAFIALLIVSCGENFKRSPVAHFSRDPQHGYEIQLDYSFRSFGGPCNFPQAPHTIFGSDWIYTDRLDGEVSTNHLIVTHERGQTEYPWAQEGLLGTVTFANGYMNISLQTPAYADGTNLSGYQPYRLNGGYKLEMR